MAQLAAKEEVCDVECFSNVIAFDVQTDVKYFAQLWEGSPPMAPPNPGYSESVQELKSIILSKASQSPGIRLSHFSVKIQDLWDALMNENFVFSFKNTQEIAVYRKLEVHYGNWTWALRSEMLNVENQLYPRIEKGQLDNVELSYLSKEMSTKYKEVTQVIVAYFEGDNDKEMLVQWRGRFENKIKEFHEDLIRAVKRKHDEVIQQSNARKKLDNKKAEFENKLLQKSKELAHLLKSIATDEEELKAPFDTVWSQWVKELTADTKPIEDLKLEEDQLVVLQDLGVEQKDIGESKKSQRYINLSEVGDYSQYIKLRRLDMAVFENIARCFLPSPEQEKIRSFINEVEQRCLEAIKSKPVATRGFTSTYLSEVAKEVIKQIETFESEKKCAFRKKFTADLCLYVFNSAESWILISYGIYKKNNDVLSYLDSKKNEYYNIFRSFYKGSSTAVVFGGIICEKIKISAVEAVFNKTGVDIAGEMRCNFPTFSENRLNLEKHVLASLAEKEDFDSFITYIHNPRKQVETFIKEEVEKYIFTTNKVKALTILQKNVENITRLVSLALFEATEKVKKQKNGNIEMWLREFYSILGPNLTLDKISCQNFMDINTFDFLTEKIEEGIENIKNEMSNLPLEKMKDSRQKPEQILIDQLCNCCWVTCPFCAAVCTNTLKDHSPEKHSVPFHRPSGVRGWHRKGTDDLVSDFCTTLVASDMSFYPEHDLDKTIPYKQYPKGGEKYASWGIKPDASMLAYWKWFVCHFQTKLEEHYNMKFQGKGKIPKQWKSSSKMDAIESLNEMCSLRRQ